MTSPTIPTPAIERALPTRQQYLVFACKAWGLRAWRWWRDRRDTARPRRHPQTTPSRDWPVLAEFGSELWPCDEADLPMVAGKLQNLRVALRRLDGIEVPAGAVWSFWKQTGRATRARGYVVGRELREGCLIPAIGGGLCQLSNAIYDSAVRAGLEVVERHRHSRVLPGSLAERDRDATVFWNYVDLRLRASFAWRLEVTMDASHLHVRIRSARDDATSSHRTSVPVSIAPRNPTPRTNDCGSCGQVRCHVHTGPARHGLRRTWWMEEAWPEFESFRQHAVAKDADMDARVFGTGGLSMPGRGPLNRTREALQWRYGRWHGHALPQRRLVQLQRHAGDLIRQLEARDTELVVPQSLLPFLWQRGALSGRRYQVMMTALPMTALQTQLDRAAARHPALHSLRDFRADERLIDAEHAALQGAGAWLSPHAQVLALAGMHAHALPWTLPFPLMRPPREDGARPRVFFPASALARKGIIELLEALHEDAVDILLPPGDGERNLDAGRATLRRVASYHDGLMQADVVALPAWVEHQPRALLTALASGIPVIATPACGLDATLPWQSVAEGDTEHLRMALRTALEKRA